MSPTAEITGRTRQLKKLKPVVLPAPQLNRWIVARQLDLIADVELQHGHTQAAERLAHRAAQLRGGA